MGAGSLCTFETEDLPEQELLEMRRRRHFMPPPVPFILDVMAEIQLSMFENIVMEGKFLSTHLTPTKFWR